MKLSAQGSASPVMFYIDNGVTNLITETTEIPLEVTDQFARTGTNTFYVSCPSIGTGTISATLTLDGGTTLSDTVSFKCIEPLRRLVSMTQVNATGHFYAGSRDWGDETGRGFYGKNDTLARIIDRLLMYGHEHEWTGDIPDWRVFGLSKTPKKGHRKVGASEIEENDRKVFTR